MATTSPLEYTGAVVVLFLSVAVAFAIGRQALALYRAWGSTSFQKRHPNLVIAFFGLVMWHLCVDVPIKCSVIMFKQKSVQKPWKLFDLTSMIHDLNIFALILIFLLRFWLLYYDFRFNDIVANLAWRLSIQPTYIDQNWWLLNRHKYGDVRYCVGVCSVGWLLGSSLYISLLKADDSPLLNLILGLIVLLLFIVPTGIAFLTLIYYVRELGDGYNIRKELTLCFKVLFITFFLYFILAVFWRGVYQPNPTDSSESQYVLLSSVITVAAEGSIAYIKAYFITVAPYRTDQIDQDLLDSIDDVPLVEILDERGSFESFMKHLISEFSVENLLFLCEVQQYRRQLKYARIEAEMTFESVPEIKLDWMPMSAYLRHRDPWLGLSYIYFKYIHKDSPHQINISAQTYKKLASFFPSTIEWSTPKLLATAVPKNKSGSSSNGGGSAAEGFGSDPSPLAMSSVKSGTNRSFIRYPWQKKKSSSKSKKRRSKSGGSSGGAGGSFGGWKQSSFFRASSFRSPGSRSGSRSDDLSAYNMTSKPGKTLFQLYFPQKFERKAVLVENVKDDGNSSVGLEDSLLLGTSSEEKRYLSPDYAVGGNADGSANHIHHSLPTVGESALSATVAGSAAAAASSSAKSGGAAARKHLGQHGKSKSANALIPGGRSKNGNLVPSSKNGSSSSSSHIKSSASLMMSEPPMRVAWSRPQSLGGSSSSVSLMFNKEGRRSSSSVNSGFASNQHYEYHEVVDEKLYQVGTPLYSLVCSVRREAQKYSARHGPPYTRELARVIQKMGGYTRILRQSHNFTAGVPQTGKIARIAANRSLTDYDPARTHKAGVTPYHIGDDAKFFGRPQQSVSMLSEFPFVASKKRNDNRGSVTRSEDERSSLVGGAASHLSGIAEDTHEEDRTSVFGVGSPSVTEVGTPSSVKSMESRVTPSSSITAPRIVSVSVPLAELGTTRSKSAQSWDPEALEQEKSLHSDLTEREKRFLMALNGETFGTESLPDMAETVFEIDEDLALDKHTLYHMFDRPEKEIWQLMNDSLMRYQQTLTYEQLAVARSYRTGKVAKRSIGVETMKKKLTNIWDGVKTSIYVRNATIDSGSTSSDLKEMLLHPSDEQSDHHLHHHHHPSASISYAE